MDLAAAYATCAEVTRREAKNFYYAFLSLPRDQRLAVYALYAFCRESDDVADAPKGDAHLLAEDRVWVEAKRRDLDRLRERLALATDGRPACERDAALADAIARFGVDPDDLNDVITGMEMDLALRRVSTEDELKRYCYHVASAVGLATLPILNAGVPPTDAMRETAIDLGLGMQYVNILRDVSEDLARDRIYLPREEFARFGITEDTLRRRAMSNPLRELVAEHASRARSLLQRGRKLIPLLPRRGRPCPWLLSEIYARILEQIAAAGYDVFAGRASLPRSEKIWLLLSTAWRRL